MKRLFYIVISPIISKIVVIIEYIFIDFIEDCLSVVSAPTELCEAYRVRSVAHKDFLVDIYAYANNTGVDGLSAKGVFDENTAKFVIANIDVIRPFDCYFFAYLVL